MFFLLRLAFWLCLVCILLPSGSKTSPTDAKIAASEAVPTPASTITGTFASSTMRRMLTGFWMPSPEPIGAAKGMIAAAPISSRRLAIKGSSVQ